MDYAALSAALIAHVRGAMSQERLSRRLGYASNVVYLWERQSRLPSVSVFLRMAEARRRPFRDGLLSLLPHGVGSTDLGRTAPLHVPSLLRALSGEHTAVELGRLTGFDRTTIARWLSGKTEPRLPDFLQFFERSSLRLLDFVALFVPPEELAVTRDAYEESRKQRLVAYEAPWSNAVLHALELSAYRDLPRHRSSLLAERLGLSVEQVESCLARLADARLIEKKAGLWRPSLVLNVDTRSDFGLNRQLKHHWASVAAERLRGYQPDHDSLFSYNVFPIARAELAQLRELHLEYYQRVRRLVSNATGADHVVVMNVQLCALDEAPGSLAIEAAPPTK